MPAMRLFTGLLAAAMLTGTSAGLADDETSFAETVDGLDQRDGLFPVYVDETDGRVLLDRARQECQEYRLRMGEAPSVLHVARYLADLQHAYTCTGNHFASRRNFVSPRLPSWPSRAHNPPSRMLRWNQAVRH